MRSTSNPGRLMTVLGVVFAASCNGRNASPPIPAGTEARVTLAEAQRDARIKKPALISINQTTSDLIYWPTKKGPSENPIAFSGPLDVYQAYAMAANGDVIVIANAMPAEIVTYDLKTQSEQSYADTYGSPYDVAIDTKGNIYAMNEVSVTVYAAGSYTEKEMTCAGITTAEAIAVNNEGDVFVDGYGPNNSMGIVKYPATGGHCKRLNLQQQKGYIGGVGVDPKTDDLIVVDNPDLCAGGYEGIMLIYPPPYRKNTFTMQNLGAEYCAGIFRLDASSKNIYFSDATVSGFPFVDSRTYPDATGGGPYGDGYSTYTGGFTTIPNTLPN
jgi:hypothetical protein